jgi:polysaccharide pyruvyl transferase WcaK-like protein
MKVLLLNDNSEQPNWGAQATPRALELILRDTSPALELKSLSWSWLRRDFRVPPFAGLQGWRIDPQCIPRTGPIVRRLTVPVETFPRIRDDFDWFADQWVSGRNGASTTEFINLARWADVVVYNGENSLYRNTIEGCRAVFLLYVAKHRLDTPSCAVNHTAHITDVRPIMRSMVQSVYPTLDVIAAREPRSWDNLRSLGIESARLAADVVFRLGIDPEARTRVSGWQRARGLEPGTYFCLSASGLPTSRPRNGWDGQVALLVRELAKLGFSAVLMARDPACQFLKEVAQRTDSAYFGPEHHYLDLWPLLEDAAFLVTGHFHYAIAASIVGCPFVPLTVNNHKMAGVCEQLGWHLDVPFDATHLAKDRHAIVEAATDLVENRSCFSQALMTRAVELRGLASTIGKWVQCAAEGRQAWDTEESGTAGRGGASHAG